ncbi:MAG: type VI secretion system tube protein TssD [Niabella sp.]
MAIEGSLQLGPSGDGGPTWRIIHMEYEFFQPVDQSGLPCRNPDGGIINLTVESSPSDTTVIHWMLSHETMTDGGAYFFDRNGRQTRSVEFKGAYCIYFKETFDAFNDTFMKIDFRISCREITIDGGGAEATLVKDWPGAAGSGSSSSSSSSSSSATSSDSSGGIGSFNPND